MVRRKKPVIKAPILPKERPTREEMNRVLYGPGLYQWETVDQVLAFSATLTQLPDAATVGDDGLTDQEGDEIRHKWEQMYAPDGNEDFCFFTGLLAGVLLASATCALVLVAAW